MDLYVYFNFRSPYCYLASRTMFDLIEAHKITLHWRPLGGWKGRSDPERAKKKLPLTRQDVARWARRMNIPFTPPPVTTDPTRAGAASLYAWRMGRLKDYTIAVMSAEWADGRDIGDAAVLADVARSAGLDPAELLASADDPANHKALEDNWVEADQRGVVGVPTFVIGADVFWGNDRLDFLAEHLHELGLSRNGQRYRLPASG